MNDKNKNLLLRVISALVLLPVVLYCLYRGDWWTALLLAWASASVAYEYITITLKGLSPVGVVAVLGAGALPILPVWKPFEATALVCGILGVVIFSGWLWHLVKGPLPEAPVRVAHLVTAVVYGGGGMISLMSVRNLSDGAWWVVCALVVTWMNDTTAYFAGRFLGKHKLYPAVSPNKTWEGFAGGLVGSIVGLVVLRAFFFPSLSVLDCLVMGVLGGVLGPAGDLCESMLKRAYGVKDSGKMIPGHGGMLDRIDALLFNAPMVLLWVQFGRGLF
ncbi:MAG: phosphatidate cytidylyltransferase [Myxococcaceae bacterium]|nr:phosphatidate cytidylyltransferase [Myxococcaceae bacterium]